MKTIEPVELSAKRLGERLEDLERQIQTERSNFQHILKRITDESLEAVCENPADHIWTEKELLQISKPNLLKVFCHIVVGATNVYVDDENSVRGIGGQTFLVPDYLNSYDEILKVITGNGWSFSMDQNMGMVESKELSPVVLQFAGQPKCTALAISAIIVAQHYSKK